MQAKIENVVGPLSMDSTTFITFFFFLVFFLFLMIPLSLLIHFSFQA